jgi:hypothetical protein
VPDDKVVEIENYRFRTDEREREDVAVGVQELVQREAIASSGKVVTQEEGFTVYAANGGRSLRKTARLLGVPEGTVLSWASRHGWRQRLLDMDLEMAEGALESGAVVLMSQYLVGIQRLITIRDDRRTSPMAAILAQKELNRMQEKVSEMLTTRIVANAIGEDLEDDELEALIQSADGVAKLLEMQRARHER